MTPERRINTALRILEEAVAIVEGAVNGGLPLQEPMKSVCHAVVFESGQQIRMAGDRIKVCARTNGDATEVYAAAVATKESILARLSLVQIMHGALMSVDKATNLR